MFMSRLEQASRDAQRSTKIIQSPPPKNFTPRSIVGNAPSSPAPAEIGTITPSPSKATFSPQRKSTSMVLHALNDYLFDLFDANMMEDFHIISRFEEKAMKHFEAEAEKEMKEREAIEEAIRNDNSKNSNNCGASNMHSRTHRLDVAGSKDIDIDSQQVTIVEYKACKDFKEFSHEEYHLHKEFLVLFESLINKFLSEHDYTADEVYDELYRHAQDKKKIETAREAKGGQPESEIDTNLNKNKDYGLNHEFGVNYDDYEAHPELFATSDALEVLDVLAFYTDFPLWSGMMKENAKYRLKFRRLGTIQRIGNDGASATHADSK